MINFVSIHLIFNNIIASLITTIIMYSIINLLTFPGFKSLHYGVAIVRKILQKSAMPRTKRILIYVAVTTY